MFQRSKMVYGVNIFPLLVMVYQLRRKWSLKQLRGHWRDGQILLKIIRQSQRDWPYFNFEIRYQDLRKRVKREQGKGVI
ncbi:hypothetical protein L7G72_14845 [Xenorhabdus bovienii]|uniref:hypothetical protein n=1 Tax=Xenorhabdus bovienii TaxID=40576 RepID=UPI001EE08670|nr:hypothetical protein [Xenorhabdus bovienii]MCG3463097.1 hypothetical protein [Xenorhabdus bovienii]